MGWSALAANGAAAHDRVVHARSGAGCTPVTSCTGPRPAASPVGWVVTEVGPQPCLSHPPVVGGVREIQGVAAGLVSLFPESDSSGTFQKVTQVIPVRILQLDTPGLEFIPEMNVTVHIRKDQS
jgi:hypothetical protein